MHLQFAESADAPPSGNASLSLWEKTTRVAVASDRAGQRQSAIAGYDYALTLARNLIRHPPPGRANDCVAALVVSLHNLADAHTASNAPERAAQILCDAHETLIAIYINAAHPADLRRAALDNTRETHVALVAHVAAHGTHSSIARSFELGRLALGPDYAFPH